MVVVGLTPTELACSASEQDGMQAQVRPTHCRLLPDTIDSMYTFVALRHVGTTHPYYTIAPT